MDDRSVVEIQIGRAPRSPVDVEARCHLGLPVVTRVPPILEDGTPFPTMHWLTCPLATLRVSRIEARRGVKRAEADLAADPDLAERQEQAMVRYREERDASIPEGYTGPRPRGGVAGSMGGVKCLHAHYADAAAGNDNPIGRRVASSIEPLDCAEPCVVDGVDGPTRNPAWFEPGDDRSP
jgi:uncharacterized protein